MSRRPAFAAALAGAVLAAALTACTPQPAATPTPTPRFTSQAQAFAAAEKTYRAYVDALNRVDLSDPKTFEGVYEWTTGEALASDKKLFTGYHSDGVRVSGRSVVTLVQPAKDSSKSREIALNACVDVSTVQLVDKAGNSIVSPTRGNVHSVRVTLEQSPGSPTGVLVSNIAGREGVPKC